MNKVVHFEIPAHDLDRAQGFYQELFGWKITKIPMADSEYYMVSTVETDANGQPTQPGAINGGMVSKTETASAPIIVINVSSIDECLTKVKEKNGKVVAEKQEVGDMGYYARVEDTEGNVIGLWEDKK